MPHFLEAFGPPRVVSYNQYGDIRQYEKDRGGPFCYPTQPVRHRPFLEQGPGHAPGWICRFPDPHARKATFGDVAQTFINASKFIPTGPVGIVTNIVQVARGKGGDVMVAPRQTTEPVAARLAAAAERVPLWP